MRKYLERLKHKRLLLKNVRIQQISHNNNCHANALATIALVHDTKNQCLVTFIVLSRAITSEAIKVINQIKDLVGTWFNPFFWYLSNGNLPKDKKKAYSIVSNLGSYVLQENILYGKTPLGYELFCVTKESIQNLLKEAHERYMYHSLVLENYHR